MTKKDPIEGFGTAEYVAIFLLQESFRFANQAAAYEVASMLFEERISDIEPDPTWEAPNIATSLTKWLKTRNDIDNTILDPVTSKRMWDAWQTAQNESWVSSKKLKKNQLLASIPDVVGYVVNLTVCLESILNRHLYFLRESNKLSPDHFISIDRAEIMPKLLFCFKEDILQKNLHISRIKRLVSLRNKAVQYRVEEFDSLSLHIEDMIGIWHELAQIFALISGEPTSNDIQNMIEDFLERWIL